MTRCATIAVASLLLLAGCARMAPDRHQEQPGSMTTSVWALRSFQGQDIPRSRPEAVTLTLLPDHGITGTASCNSVSGREVTWAASSDTEGTFARDASQPTVTTLVGCTDAAATETAGRFWTLMANARGWSINHGALSIRFNDGTAALLKPIRRAPERSDDCRNAKPNNFDCPRTADAPEAKPR